MALSKIKTTNMSEDVVLLDSSAASTDIGERLLLDGTDSSATNAGYAVLSEKHTASMTGVQDDPSGTVLQIVKAKQDQNKTITVNSASHVTAGVAFRIYPKKLNSLFLIHFNVMVAINTANRYPRPALYRSLNGATAVQLATDTVFGGMGAASGGAVYGHNALQYMDQPPAGGYSLGQYIEYQVYMRNLNSVNIYVYWYSGGNDPDVHIFGGNGCSGTVTEIDNSALPYGGGNAGSSHIAQYGQPS
tara:strand:- start:237 stop:974 length:738 start_codon:yes stop_codon:yes gene_type:complete